MIRVGLRYRPATPPLAPPLRRYPPWSHPDALWLFAAPGLPALTAAADQDAPNPTDAASPPSRPRALAEVLTASTKLGLTSFGGPVAHLGYFREEYVQRRRWLDDAAYADLVALCQFPPGPASSQVGIAIGMLRAGLLGGIVSWIGFTLPSALALVLFAVLVRDADIAAAGWLHGLKVVAVAVVAYALWGMARSLAPDRERATIAIAAAIAVIASETAIAQVGVIVAGGLIGYLFLKSTAAQGLPTVATRNRRRLAIAAGALFVVLLAVLPIAREASDNQGLAVFDSFYRVGSLVFGGGHVVLPLLQTEVVGPDWVTSDDFVAGYGAAQAVPGPLFTFTAYLGFVMGPEPNGLAGAALALVAVYVPSFLLVIAILPFWGQLRTFEAFQRALRGINAAVVGILLAALYTPVWTSAIFKPEDFGLGIAAFGLLAFWRLPPWLVVAFTATGGELLSRL